LPIRGARFLPCRRFCTMGLARISRSRIADPVVGSHADLLPSSSAISAWLHASFSGGRTHVRRSAVLVGPLVYVPSICGPYVARYFRIRRSSGNGRRESLWVPDDRKSHQAVCLMLSVPTRSSRFDPFGGFDQLIDQVAAARRAASTSFSAPSPKSDIHDRFTRATRAVPCNHSRVAFASSFVLPL